MCQSLFEGGNLILKLKVVSVSFVLYSFVFGIVEVNQYFSRNQQVGSLSYYLTISFK